ncbi:hypothetical protein, partial [Mycolicibacterium sp. J2]|uniref:hypothetical protein n=1 Tax=Mycolicibacterium sp. J2 TaxID=2993511 RepID=UPI002A055335|nr:hypothetical protein [Mycolicibacterium sp. J2]
ASPTGYAITTPPRKPCAEQPPAPTNNYTDRCSQVRNFGEHSRGFSMSAVSYDVRGGFQGFNLAELATLDRYRVHGC